MVTNEDMRRMQRELAELRKFKRDIELEPLIEELVELGARKAEDFEDLDEDMLKKCLEIARAVKKRRGNAGVSSELDYVDAWEHDPVTGEWKHVKLRETEKPVY